MGRGRRSRSTTAPPSCSTRCPGPPTPTWRCASCTGSVGGAPRPRGGRDRPATTASRRCSRPARRPGLRRRLVAVLGASSALGDHLVANPTQWRVLATGRTGCRRPPTARLEPAARRPPTVAGAAPGVPARAAADRGRRPDRRPRPGADDGRAVRAGRRDAGGGVRDRGRRAAARAPPRPGSPSSRWASAAATSSTTSPTWTSSSWPPATRTWPPATSVAARLIEICGQVAWPVDARAAARGQPGPAGAHARQPPGLLPALGAHLGVPGAAQGPAGGRRPGARRRSGSTSWRRWSGTRPSGRRRSRTSAACAAGSSTTCRADELDREIKRGPGGLRDIEFAVQLLQLVHGRGDETLRAPGTLAGAARAGRRRLRRPRRRRGAAARLPLPAQRRAPAAAAAPAAYPHRARPTRPALRWLAAALGYTAAARARRRRGVPRRLGHPRRRGAPAARQAALPAAAGGGRPGARRGAAADARRRPGTGWRCSASPTRPGRCGTSRRSPAGSPAPRRSSARCCRCCCSEFADAPEPDRGLLNYRQVSDKLGSTPWYLRLLRDERPGRPAAGPGARPVPVRRRPARPRPGGAAAARRRRRAAAARRARCCATASPRRPAPARRPGRGRSRRGPRAAPPRAVPARLRRPAQPGRRARPAPPADGRCDVDSPVGMALSDVTDATLAAALRAARAAPAGAAGAAVRGDRHGPARRVRDELPLRRRRAVRLRPAAGHGRRARPAPPRTPIAEELRRLLGVPAPDPPLGVDADLRPEGRQGPLVRSLAAYAQYYARWSKVWEAQALLRARFVCGDADLGARVRGAGRPGALPGRRADPRAGHRDPPDQGAGGDRAAAPRRRPGHPHQARPRRAGRRRVGGAAAAAAARRRGARRCAAPVPSTRSPRPATPAWSTRRTPRRWPPAGPWPRRCATR